MVDEFQPVAWALEQQVAGFPSITCASHEQGFCESLAAFTSGAIVVPLVRASALSALREERDKLCELNRQLVDKANGYVIHNARLEEQRNEALAERDAAREALRVIMAQPGWEDDEPYAAIARAALAAKEPKT